MKAWEIAAAAKERKTKRAAIDALASENGLKVDWQDEITGKVVHVGKKYHNGTINAVYLADKVERAPHAVVTEYTETTIVMAHLLVVSVTFEVK
jgi:hypothetical protein